MTDDRGFEKKCIFCLDPCESAPAAHIFSESLIQGSPILPEGAECGSCNNLLSRMEKKFINDYLGSFMHLIELSATKKGQPPKLTWPGVTMTAVDHSSGKRTIQINMVRTPFPSLDQLTLGASPEGIEIPMPPEKPSLVSRFACKVGLEALRYLNWPEVFDPAFHDARRFAITPSKGRFIPYAYRPNKMNQTAVRILSEIPFSTLGDGNPVPPIIIRVPGLELLTVLTPWPTCKVLIEEARAADWLIRWSEKRPRPSRMKLLMCRSLDGA
jgi:hypothetical protein